MEDKNMGKAKSKSKSKSKAKDDFGDIHNAYPLHTNCNIYNEYPPVCVYEVTLINLIRHLTMLKVINKVPDYNE